VSSALPPLSLRRPFEQTLLLFMTTITEIAPDLFRLSIYVPDFDM
jgi:hypothetical protein